MKKFTAFVLLIVLLSSSLTLVSCDTNDILHIHSLGKREAIPSVAPTCNEGGLTEGEKCATCGAILVAQEPIAPLGHDYLRHDETDENGDTLTIDVCQREGCKESKIVTDKDKLIEEWRKAAGVAEGGIEITIKYYIASPIDNIRAALRIKVSYDNIYLSDYIIDKVEYINNPPIDYKGVLFTNTDKVINGEKVTDTIEKIKALEYCYKLEMQGKYGPLEPVLVYELDGRYYFLGFHNQELWIIHCTNFKDGV